MNAADRVMQSYGRCCASTGFFDDFYRHFRQFPTRFAPSSPPQTLTAQKHLLRAGIMNLVMYARGMSDSKLQRTRRQPFARRAGYPPELYDLWLDALLMAVAEHDRDCDAETRDAWRDVMGRGIAVIKSYY